MESRIFILMLILTAVKASSDVKSSLTFVIDDTGSMRGEIDQVKSSVNDIFDTVMNSNSSQIEDFVIVTFNDPGTYVRTVTKDRGEFKEALARIRVDGGVDCPELAMEGIAMALENSREGSLLFVYTDASAKDYDKFPKIEALSQKKQSQIIFVLTGQCGTRNDPDYLVYNKIARATSGQVFHLMKNEVNQIMSYVRKTIENRKNVITSKAFPPGNGNSFNVSVDADTKELVISVSGKGLSVGVTDSGGTRMPTEEITRLSEVLIVNVLGVKPDVYKVEVNSTSDTTVVVSGTTTVHFQHGFSILEPTVYSDTVTRPVPGEKSHLSIKLAAEGGNVTLTSVQILDMDENVLMEKPLKLVDEGEQFYTTEPVDLPNHMFKIAIKGYDAESDTFLTRISLTPIQPQDPAIDVVYQKAPTVAIDGGDKINAEYDKPVQLKCKVNGYPKPIITWESDDPTETLTPTESVVELPYDYVSVLNLNNVKKNATYTCKAENRINTDSKSIAVETKINRYFNVLEMPTDTTIEYLKQGQMRCNVDAMPPATLYWYKGRKPLEADGNIELSADNATLTIRSMQPNIADDYICEARNAFDRKVARFRVGISGVEIPVIDKIDYYILALKHSNVNITCNVTKGEPRPTIKWLYQNDEMESFQELNMTGNTIPFEDADMDLVGMYRCVATNVVGEDYHDVDLVVEYPPSATRDIESSMTVNEGEMVTLHCPVDGLPSPHFTWTLNGTEIRRMTHMIYSDGSIRFTTSLNEAGSYECKAENDHGETRMTTYLNIIAPVTIEPPRHSEVKVIAGHDIALPCRADGTPKPNITWVFYSKDPDVMPKNLNPNSASGTLIVPKIQLIQDGYYTCIASNAGGSKNITYTVTVYAPPSIVPSEKRFTAVLDDWLVRIPCQALGHPKPVITWSKSGYDLASGSEWYEIEETGSLIVKNIDSTAAGSYVCTATNQLGSDNESFDLSVESYPDPGFLTDVTSLEEGTSKSINCSVPHEKIDRIRWFKNGHIVGEKLELNNVTLADSGVYTCRVSGLTGARSGSLKVEVNPKLKFIVNGNNNINYELGTVASMDCRTTGNPEPEVIWLRDGTVIDSNSTIYELQMSSPRDIGRYICFVRNNYATIQKEFIISSHECVLDIANDFNGNEPLMLTPYREFAKFENIDGHMHIPKDENIILACPAGFERIPQREVLVTCVNEKQFSYEDTLFSYSELKCRDKVKPIVTKTGRRCSRTIANSEMMRIGFDIGTRFVEVYAVCLDKTANKTLYTKQNMQPTLANALPEHPFEWLNDDPPMDLDSLYDCSYQNNRVSSILNMDFHRSDGCCFARRQLVDPRNVPSGLAQTATYTSLNVAPYWSTCNSRNWEDLERRIRNLAISANHELQVWSGTAQELELLDAYSGAKKITFTDRGKEYAVPKYFWKVIQDPVTKSSLAVIQVNVPDVTLAKARNYFPCRDVCPEVDWMRNRRWRHMASGLTYCCSLPEFKRAFRIAGVFPPYNKLLKTVTPLPFESSALHVI